MPREEACLKSQSDGWLKTKACNALSRVLSGTSANHWVNPGDTYSRGESEEKEQTGAAADSATPREEERRIPPPPEELTSSGSGAVRKEEGSAEPRSSGGMVPPTAAEVAAFAKSVGIEPAEAEESPLDFTDQQ